MALVGMVAALAQGCGGGPPIVPNGGEYLATMYGGGGNVQHRTGVWTTESRPAHRCWHRQEGKVVRAEVETVPKRGTSCGSDVQIWHTGPAAKHMTRFCHLERVDVEVGEGGAAGGKSSGRWDVQGTNDRAREERICTSR